MAGRRSMMPRMFRNGAGAASEPILPGKPRIKPPSRDVALARLARAERLGLTYAEYTLEILERGRHLGPDDTERVAEIKAARRARRRRKG